MENAKLNKPKTIIKDLLRNQESTVFLVVIGMCILLTISSSHFLTSSNIISIFLGIATQGLIVIVMTLVLTMGGIDLSLGSLMGLSSILAVLAANAGINIWLSVLIAIIATAFCGSINGYLVSKGLPPFIVTLSMQIMIRGVCLSLTKGSAISYQYKDKMFMALGQGNLVGIPILIIIFILFTIAGDFALRRTEFFRKISYVGSNEKAALHSGIDVAKVKIIIYTLAGLMAGLAGIITLSRFGSATPTIGEGIEMNAISAAIIGGTSLAGGTGTIFGTFLGLILISLINNGLVLLNISVYAQKLVTGFILLMAILIDHLRQTENKTTLN